MTKPRILTLEGGISQNSLNRKLCVAFKEVAGNRADFTDAQISSLPYFSQDLEYDPPDSVINFKDQIREADAVLFVTPEYNRSIPGVLKNAIDWGSRPYPENLWEKLPVATLGASSGNTGTFGAQSHLRQILSYLNMYILNQPEFYMNGSKAFDNEDNLTDEKSKKKLVTLWDTFEEWIQSHSLIHKKYQIPHEVDSPTWDNH